MFFKREKPLKQMSDDELEAHRNALEEKSDSKGRVAGFLKLVTPLFIMTGALVVCVASGFTLAHLGIGMGVGLLGMVGARVSAEQASDWNHKHVTKSLQHAMREQTRRVQAQLDEVKSQLKQQAEDAAKAPERKAAMERAIDQDFNGGAAKPVAVSGGLKFRKNPAPQFAGFA